MVNKLGRRLTQLRLIGNPLQAEHGSETSGLHRQIHNTFPLDNLHFEERIIFKDLDIEELQPTPPSEKLPEFVKHKETTNIELFYYLFFVANLTTFSSVHEINDQKTLTTYVGFFCILWFTWCQVSLFDVRFVADSVVERAAKAVHLGVTIGFAIVGPQLVPTATGYKVNAFRTIWLILMVSRLVLALQYLMFMWQVRKYRSTTAPLLLIAFVNCIAAAIYLGVTFAFESDKTTYAYRSFYVVAVFEIAANILISSLWRVLSFKGTHLEQRMSLLTLIILGEGVLVITQSIVKIVQKHNAWNSPSIGTAIAAIIIIVGFVEYAGCDEALLMKDLVVSNLYVVF